MTTDRTTATDLAARWGLRVRHALYRASGDWYHHLRAFPGALLDRHGYVLFRTEDEYVQCSGLQRGKQVGVPAGIRSIPGYVRMTPGTDSAGVDRLDPQEARAVFRALLPDAQLAAAGARLLARSIEVAQAFEPRSWSISLFPRMIRLNVGQVEVCTLSSEAMRLVASVPAAADADSHVLFESTGAPVYAAVPVPSGTFVLAGTSLRAVPSWVLDAHHEYIGAAAQLKPRSPFRRSFSVGVLTFLEEALEIRLPRPGYFADLELPRPPRSADEVLSLGELLEGATRTIVVNAYERDARARQLCIDTHGARCSACEMSFGEAYGEALAGFIHVHHLRPISVMGGEYRVDPVADLRPVCPNCHAVIHSRSPPLTIEEVRRLLRVSSPPNAPPEQPVPQPLVVRKDVRC